MKGEKERGKTERENKGISKRNNRCSENEGTCKKKKKTNEKVEEKKKRGRKRINNNNDNKKW